MSDVTDEMARRALEVLQIGGLIASEPVGAEDFDIVKQALAEALIVYRDSLPQPADPSWREKHGLYDG